MSFEIYWGNARYQMVFEATPQSSWLTEISQPEPHAGPQVAVFPAARTIYVFNGLAEVELPTGKQDITAGGVLYVPANGHALITNVGRGALSFLTVCGPPGNAACFYRALLELNTVDRAELESAAEIFKVELYLPTPKRVAFSLPPRGTARSAV